MFKKFLTNPNFVLKSRFDFNLLYILCLQNMTYFILFEESASEVHPRISQTSRIRVLPSIKNRLNY